MLLEVEKFHGSPKHHKLSIRERSYHKYSIFFHNERGCEDPG